MGFFVRFIFFAFILGPSYWDRYHYGQTYVHAAILAEVCSFVTPSLLFQQAPKGVRTARCQS